MEKLLLALPLCFGAYLPNQVSGQITRSPAAKNSFITVPLSQEHWETVYDGLGEVRFENDTIYLEPAASQEESETHAALLVLRKDKHPTSKNFKLRIRYETLNQLRTPTPNQWEVFWLMFNTQISHGNFVQANYLIQKPESGFELGRASAGSIQNFLKTDATQTLAIQEQSEIEIEKIDQSLYVYKNGVSVFEYQGDESDIENFLYNEQGQLALYTEDASVAIYDFSYMNLD